MKKFVAFIIGFVLLANSIVLGKAFYNRTQVITKLELSERELQLPLHYGFAKEDSSKRVSLRWSTLNTELLSKGADNYWSWSHNQNLALSEAQFASFQFPSCEKNSRRNNKQMAWVLMEFNGPAYSTYVDNIEKYHALVQGSTQEVTAELSQKDLQEKEKRASDMLESAKNTDSRLFIIDAAPKRELLMVALRERQNLTKATLFILPAEVQAGYYRCDKKEKRTTEVIVNNLAVSSLYLPKELVQDSLPTKNDNVSTYTKSKIHFLAEVSYGRLYEPWVSKFELSAKNLKSSEIDLKKL
jgi:Domain of unknown function (DUF4824)